MFLVNSPAGHVLFLEVVAFTDIDKNHKIGPFIFLIFFIFSVGQFFSPKFTDLQ